MFLLTVACLDFAQSGFRVSDDDTTILIDDCTAAAVAGRRTARQERPPRADDVGRASRHVDLRRTGRAAHSAGSGRACPEGCGGRAARDVGPRVRAGGRQQLAGHVETQTGDRHTSDAGTSAPAPSNVVCF